MQSFGQFLRKKIAVILTAVLYVVLVTALFIRVDSQGQNYILGINAMFAFSLMVALMIWSFERSLMERRD